MGRLARLPQFSWLVVSVALAIAQAQPAFAANSKERPAPKTAVDVREEKRAREEASKPESAASENAITESAAPVDEKTGLRTEAQDRAVDGAANSAQKLAIQKLKAQLARNENQPAEAMLLWRLAELQNREAQTLFRVIHGKA